MFCFHLHCFIKAQAHLSLQDKEEENDIYPDIEIISFSQTRSTPASDSLVTAESSIMASRLINVETSNHSPSVTVSIFDALADILTSTPKITSLTTTGKSISEERKASIDKIIAVSTTETISSRDSSVGDEGSTESVFTVQSESEPSQVTTTNKPVQLSTEANLGSTTTSYKNSTDFLSVTSPMEPDTPPPTTPFTAPPVSSYTLQSSTTRPVTDRKPFATLILYSTTQRAAPTASLEPYTITPIMTPSTEQVITTSSQTNPPPQETTQPQEAIEFDSNSALNQQTGEVENRSSFTLSGTDRSNVIQSIADSNSNIADVPYTFNFALLYNFVANNSSLNLENDTLLNANPPHQTNIMDEPLQTLSTETSIDDSAFSLTTLPQLISRFGIEQPSTVAVPTTIASDTIFTESTNDVEVLPTDDFSNSITSENPTSQFTETPSTFSPDQTTAKTMDMTTMFLTTELPITTTDSSIPTLSPSTSATLSEINSDLLTIINRISSTQIDASSNNLPGSSRRAKLLRDIEKIILDNNIDSLENGLISGSVLKSTTQLNSIVTEDSTRNQNEGTVMTNSLQDGTTNAPVDAIIEQNFSLNNDLESTSIPDLKSLDISSETSSELSTTVNDSTLTTTTTATNTPTSTSFTDIIADQTTESTSSTTNVPFDLTTDAPFILLTTTGVPSLSFRSSADDETSALAEDDLFISTTDDSLSTTDDSLSTTTDNSPSPLTTEAPLSTTTDIPLSSVTTEAQLSTTSDIPTFPLTTEASLLTTTDISSETDTPVSILTSDVPSLLSRSSADEESSTSAEDDPFADVFTSTTTEATLTSISDIPLSPLTTEALLSETTDITLSPLTTDAPLSATTDIPVTSTENDTPLSMLTTDPPTTPSLIDTTQDETSTTTDTQTPPPDMSTINPSLLSRLSLDSLDTTTFDTTTLETPTSTSYTWVPPYPTAWSKKPSTISENLARLSNPSPLASPGIQSSTTNRPKKDYYIYGVLPNNTVVRKNPNNNELETLTEASPFIIFGVLSNNTVLRKFPNGTNVPPFRQQIDVLPIDPRSLRNPFSAVYRNPESIIPINNFVDDINTNEITQNKLVESSVSRPSTEIISMKDAPVNNTQSMVLLPFSARMDSLMLACF